MRREVGVLLAAGGATLAWLLKKRMQQQPRVRRRCIVVGPKNGECGLLLEPSDVKLHVSEQLHWLITNCGDDSEACDEAVEVSIRNWNPSEPLDDTQKGRFSRTVRPGQTKTLPARVKKGVAEGKYRYEVWIANRPAKDPMVEIVL